jgi:hypothetical protein
VLPKPTINFPEGELTTQAGETCFRRRSLTVTPLAGTRPVGASRSVVPGLRPEDVGMLETGHPTLPDVANMVKAAGQDLLHWTQPLRIAPPIDGLAGHSRIHGIQSIGALHKTRL